MKRLFILTATLVMLTTSFYSCEDKEAVSELGGDVLFAFCPDEDENRSGNVDTLFIKGEAYLFNDSVPDFMRTKIEEEFKKSGYVAYIVYESDSEARLYISTQSEYSTNYICNYPDFAEQWEVPLTGQKVYFEGKAYFLGAYLGVPMSSVYDFGLTVLKTM